MNSIFDLDDRLCTIAKMVRNKSCLADVGCDHGLLITALAQDDIIASGIACDINAMPINKARMRISDLNMEEKIAVLQTDGLDGIGEDDVDDIVIAGMGGELIVEIMEKCPWSKRNDKNWILQPMTKAPFLRGWLCKNGFEIKSEKSACVSKKYYSVINAVYTGNVQELAQDDSYIYIGELLSDKSDKTKKLIQKVALSINKKALGLEKSGNQDAEKFKKLYLNIMDSIKGW